MKILAKTMWKEEAGFSRVCYDAKYQSLILESLIKTLLELINYFFSRKIFGLSKQPQEVIFRKRNFLFQKVSHFLKNIFHTNQAITQLKNFLISETRLSMELCTFKICIYLLSSTFNVFLSSLSSFVNMLNLKI